MPLLSFDVYSNYEEVARLRSEITMLENRLKSFGPGASISSIRAVEAQLQSARTKFRGLAMDAAQAGASLEMNIRKGVNGAIAAVNELQDKISEPIRGLTEAAGIGALGLFLNQVKNIRSEFQQMETSINVLVGEKKGQTLMNQLTEFAKISPLDFRGTVGGAQMMLGFGLDADKIPRYLSAIGDVAMGDAGRFQSLTLAFSQMSAAGKLMGQDLMQMVNAGFQPLNQMSIDTGKSIGQLKKEMSEGKISAEMVQQAFINATSDGGKYYQMSEKASQTLGGQMSMLQDATELMFNDLGQNAEGFVMKAIQGATWLVENWQSVGRVLIGALATYGVYKTSKMAMDFAEKKSEEEKTQAVIDGYTKQLQAMEDYERAKAGHSIDTLTKPNAVSKLENGEALNDSELNEVKIYTQRLAELQKEKEARDAVTDSMQAELDKLRELNAEKDATPTENKKTYDADLQAHLDDGTASEELVAKLQEQRDLIREKAELAGQNVALADDEYNKAMANMEVAQNQVSIAEQRKKNADELVAKLQEEYDLLQEDDLMNAPLDEYGEVTESLETLAKAEELERAEKEASLRASELLQAQAEAESAALQANEADERLNAAMEESAIATANRHALAQQQDTATIVANTTATQANTTSTTASTTATTTNTVAQGKNTLATKMAVTWTKLKTVGHHLEKSAIDGVTRATNALKAAWATNPFGLVLTVLSTIATTLWSVFGSMNDAKEKSTQFGEAASKSANDVNLLYNVLEATNKESKVYKESLDKIISTMREYGIKIDDEADKLEQVNKNRERLIDLIVEEGRQREIANNLADMQNSTKEDRESLENLMSELIISGDRSDEWKEMGAKIIAEDVERNAEEIAQLQQTLASYAKAKRDVFTEWTDKDQQTLDAAIARYDELVYGRANKLAEKYGSDLMTIRTSDMQGYVSDRDLGWIGNYTEALIKRNEQMKEYSELQSESLAKTEAAQEKPDPYSAAGKSFDDLIKDIKEAKDEITSADSELTKLGQNKAKVNVDKKEADDAKEAVNNATSAVKTHTSTDGKTNIDSTDAVTSESNTDDATAAVENHTATDGKTNIDSTDSDVARIKTEGATDEVARLDGVSADPEIKTTWVDNFIKKIGEAWDTLMDFLGVSGDDRKKVAAPTVTPTKKKESDADRIRREREEATAKREVAIKEMYDKASKANTDKEFADARKALTEYKSTLAQDSAEYRRVTKELEKLDKRDKSKNKDDPKQRAYELRKARLEEEKRTAELLQAEKNRQRELEIAQMEDNSEKEIETIKFTAEKKRQALERELRKEAETLEKNALQQWLKGSKNRKEYQYYAQFSEAQLREMREGYEREARERIGYDTQRSLIADTEANDLSSVYRTDISAMRDYLKQYGTFQQKKLAIAEEYAEKIRNAQNEGERLTLTAQRDTELRNLESTAITSQIDWYSVFDNVGVVMRGQLEPLYKQLQEYVKSEAFRKSGADNQQAVISAMENIRSQLGTNESWKDLSSALADYQTALNELRVATENDTRVSAENARLLAAQRMAQDNLDSARRSGKSEAELKTYSDALEAATLAVNNYSSTVAGNNQALSEAQARVQSSGTMLSMSAKNVIKPVSKIYTFLSGAGLSQLADLWGAFDQLKGGIEGLKALKDAANASKELSEAAETASDAVSDTATKLPGILGIIQEQVPELFNQLSQAANDIADGVNESVDGVSDGMEEAGKTLADVLPDELLDGLGKAGLIGQIIAAVLKILDILKDGVGTLISSILDSVFGAISGIIDNILSGEIFKQIGESLYKGILGIFKSIFTMGGLFDWWGNGESDKHLEGDIERLTATNEALRKAVGNLADEMRDAATADMGARYQRQKGDIEKAMKNTQEMMSRSGAAYSNGFLGIGGHKSSNHKINKGMSGDDWSRISAIVGKSVRSAGDFWNLTSEQMAKVAQSAPDLYAKIKGLADDGHKDAAQFMDEYIEYYKELEELENAFRELLTDVSFDSVKDEFKSMLLDMESDSEDFANNFEKMMQQAVINSLMNSKYNKKLKQWYKDFAAAMDDQDGLTAAEQERLKRDWDNIVGDAVNDRNNLKKAMGWDGSSEQQSSSRTLEGMSQDTGNAIEGRLTALQIAVESIRANENQHTLSLADMTDELLQIAMEYSRFNVHQDNIERQMAKMYIELQTISENTGAIVKPIIAMQEDIAEIKRNTKNL